MKIVALDTFVADFDSLEWTGFSELGDFSKYDSSSLEEAKERAKDAEAIIVNKVLVNEELLSSLPKLKYVGVTATGVNNVDLELTKKLGIAVTNIPGYSTNSVAEIVFAYLHDHYLSLPTNSSKELLARYVKGKYFSIFEKPSRELAGKTIGIIGFGSIGQQVAKLAEAYQMEVLLGAIPGRDYSDHRQSNRVSLEELFSKSDVVTLHCPLTTETENLINLARLKQMKRTAVLINTARGPIVNEPDLASAMLAKEISHAYLDVLCQEPTAADNPLLSLANVTITPHIAWATKESRSRLINQAHQNLSSYLAGQSQNLV